MRNDDYVDFFDMPLFQKYLTDEEKVAGRTILNFIDWFSPTLEIKGKLQHEMIILLCAVAQYEKTSPILREYYEKQNATNSSAE